ncbi:MAG: FG-GAP repeat protein [Flavobacteriales bacterium]|nr:MAG: FG-GAP repeat protein [Flavobacteriales bacterium]
MRRLFASVGRLSGLLLGLSSCAALFLVSTDASVDLGARNDAPSDSTPTDLAEPIETLLDKAHAAEKAVLTTGPAIATNASHGLQATVLGNGMVCRPLFADRCEWAVSILVGRIGRGSDWSEPNLDAPTELTDEHMLSRHGAFDLEHINNEAGLRQNFIVHRKPQGDSPLRVELRTEGDLVCTHAGADIFHFADTAGIVQMSYSDLHVWDANGDTLRAVASLEEGLIVLSVDDEQATYPIVVDPLAGTAIWTTESNLATARLGTCLASAGDVNGDGYSDILIGVPLWANGQTGEGRVQLHYGSASGPSAAISWSYETNQLGANMGLGNSVATAGDVNGDGYSDIIVGAPYFDNGESNEGRVLVFHGSATGLTAAPQWTAESNQANALFGFVVNCAGDVNGDGYSDVLVGAYQYENGQTDEGAVFVYHGSATGLSAVADWVKEGDQTLAYFGRSAASAGDVNGDGYSDVIIGAPLFDNGQTNEGRAFVYHGSATGLAATPAWTAESDQASSQTGFSVSSAGDVNNDGYSDVVVGIPFHTNSFLNDGRVVIYRGSASGLVSTSAWSYNSLFQEAQFGKSVACAGDVNGDGFSDVLFGGPEYTSGQAQEGRAYVFFGNLTAAMSLAWSGESNQAGARWGGAVASAGDVNGDGFSDVLIGVPEWDNGQTNEGMARCYLGGPASINTLAPEHTLIGPVTFSRSVSSAGDVNGDGYGDIVIGAPDARLVTIHHGSTNGPSIAPDRSYLLPGVQGYGYCVSGAGDVNGDGYGDVIVGTDYGNTVYVYHGSATGLPVAANWSVTGTANTRFGFSVGSAGDVNGDGYADVIIGQPGHNSGAGRVVVHHGSPTGLSIAPNWVSTPFDAPHLPNSFYGEGVDVAGDVNGDGYSDVIIGAGGYNGNRGRVVIFHGSPGGLGAAPASTFDDTVPGHRLGSNSHSGSCVSSTGDVNGDGYSDVIMAWMGGQAFVHSGGPTGVSATPVWASTLYGGGFFAATVSSAGDINADGYSDVVISSCAQGALLYFGGPTGLVGAAEDQLFAGSSSHSATGAGDVNGDGYCDLLVGQYGAGRAYVFHGNTSTALARGNFRLYQTDLTTPLSASNIPIPQFGAGLFVRPFLGRSRTRLVWETRIQGQAFSIGSNGLVNNSTDFTAQQPAFIAGAVAGVELKSLIDKPGGGTGITATKVRTRVRYDPVTAITGQVFGPWRYMPGYLDGHGTHNNVPLPVELLRFDARCVNGSVELSWATASEENSSHFVVERSTDAEAWAEVARVEAAGHSHQVLEYILQDAAPPYAITVYYRLKQEDLDGTTTVLPITRSTSCASLGAPYPNPTDGLVHLDLGVAFDAAKRVDVIDAQGRTVLEVLPPGLGTALTVNLSGLLPGTYTVRILAAAGTTISTDRIIKH